MLRVRCTPMLSVVATVRFLFGAPRCGGRVRVRTGARRVQRTHALQFIVRSAQQLRRSLRVRVVCEHF